ncbi:MAG: 3-hydroxy-3-methylglutaryl-CoA reductase [Candidatus Sericytochromatia bacterium]|nr:3-hydroxy-3-methylglutaryl-CoA reductase [Candidatus Sericytochromatia bacterium]
MVARRQWIEQAHDCDLHGMSGEDRLSAERFRNNIESQVGFIQIPVSAAGPLLIHGEHAQGIFYVPLATTEGALSASATRGAKAATLSGGVTVRVVSDQMMRAPLFVFESLVQSMAFVAWIGDHLAEIHAIAKEHTRHGRLRTIEPVVLGDSVCVKLAYHTGDAYGANMVMACNHAISQWALAAFPAETGISVLDHYVDSQMSAEKKVNYMTYATSTHGKRVVAECLLKRDVIQAVLKTTAEDLFEALVSGTGPAWAAGVMGYNINFANIVAAIFAATGQDLATIPESSQGQLSFRLQEDGLYIGSLMPNLVVATVGGGVGLPSQQASLAMIDCQGAGKALKLAEIIAATALCLDISTCAAICADHFVKAHQHLGRTRPRTGMLRPEDAAGKGL